LAMRHMSISPQRHGGTEEDKSNSKAEITEATESTEGCADATRRRPPGIHRGITQFRTEIAGSTEKRTATFGWRAASNTRPQEAFYS
jgi:hypothetical protein